MEQYARVSPASARRLAQRLVSRAEQLPAFPALGRLSHRLRADGVRELIEGEFVILYLAQRTRIDILAIVSGREGLPPPGA